MAVSAQALIDEAARLKERYPDADHMAMAEAVLAERERGAKAVENRAALFEAFALYDGAGDFSSTMVTCGELVRSLAGEIRGGHQ